MPARSAPLALLSLSLVTSLVAAPALAATPPPTTTTTPSPTTTPAPGPAAPRSDDAIRLSVTEYKLPNGLSVLIHEDHAAPVVAVNLWYLVGSKDEKPGRTGFAHLFEHLMFQGSVHVGDDQHLALVAQAGGSANATTSEDRTNFFETLPSNYLELALYLEADRMGFLVEALTQDKLDTQRGVVQNERRQSYENQPYGMSRLALRETLYPETHPYHHPAIGSHADLEAATLDDVKQFFRAWYTPDNAVLTIAGDVDPARAIDLVMRWFGPIPSGMSHGSPPRPQVAEVVLAADKRIRLGDRVSFERLSLVWPSPRWFAPGDAELDLLATVLGGKSGRLYRRLVHEQQIAQSVAVMQLSAKLGSEFHIVAMARPGHTAAEMEKVVGAELAKLLGAEPITDEELARAKSAWEAQFVYGLEGYEHRADMLSAYYEQLGDVVGFARDRERYLKATRAEVMKTAASVLGAHHVVMVVGPEGATPATGSGATPGAAAGAAAGKESR